MEQLKQIIKSLILERAFLKQTLRDLANQLSEDEINELLDKLMEIENLIKKLEKGL